ncbi:MAG: hypothetical protein M1831_002814 [Alyxoria varia]|nr:MAG: hypothetical protein M1831_002814 [Alyxoria varia]
MARATNKEAGPSAERQNTGQGSGAHRPPSLESSTSTMASQSGSKQRKWTLGILGDKETEEVPGSVLLLSSDSTHNAPLGMHKTPRRSSASSIPSQFQRTASRESTPRVQTPVKKRTADGKIILDPQPEDTLNDPLNWTSLRRDSALFSLGLYCMVGGGMTPILAAAFTDVADTYSVSIPEVALTTGLYMAGLGVGCVISSPTAILFGKRPIYLVAAIGFVLSSIWCAASPNYISLVLARIFQGIFVSPVESLPSASIAEIYFLHERAYRLGIYTLLLLGGKNLTPLVSAAITQSLGWRWVFWIVAIIVGFCGLLLFFFVPETFWDRTPRPHKHHHDHHHDHCHDPTEHHQDREDLSRGGDEKGANGPAKAVDKQDINTGDHQGSPNSITVDTYAESPKHSPKKNRERHAHFADMDNEDEKGDNSNQSSDETTPAPEEMSNSANVVSEKPEDKSEDHKRSVRNRPPDIETGTTQGSKATSSSQKTPSDASHYHAYTHFYRHAPPKSYLRTLKPWSGRLGHYNWFRVAFRPFVLFAYPSILWSTAIYSLSVGWLIVLSEAVAHIYREHDSYHFSALSTGLVYISPFIGGILGTAVAGKLSDVIVRFMARRNGGIYEPEFRLIMAIPVAISTTIGLVGFGWSAQERNAWIVPTVFFGIISFGCSLGSTTAITFAVDSYRQYAGEALVTLNFSKNVLHGLVFSLFFNRWLEDDGAKTVFLALGGIQLGVLFFTIPMYIYGKRARMWTVRKNFMEKF